VSDLTLDGYGVLVTRPTEQAANLIAAIRANGGTAIEFPVLEIVGRNPDTVATELAELPDPDIVIFVSTNAVRFGAEIARQGDAEFGAIGPATRATAEANGIQVSIFPDSGFDSEHLLQQPQLTNVQGRNITIVRGEHGRQALGDELNRRGATVNYLSAYRRQVRRAPESEISAIDALWNDNRINCVTVLSVETLQNLVQLLSPASVEWLTRTPLVAPGARVIQTAQEMLPGLRTVAAKSAATDDILDALIGLRNSDNTNE
jgi:uroporphyrinogen-III synthase